jgi:hypothetical protein
MYLPRVVVSDRTDNSKWTDSPGLQKPSPTIELPSPYADGYWLLRSAAQDPNWLTPGNLLPLSSVSTDPQTTFCIGTA